jgi:alkaline phosphatase D
MPLRTFTLGVLALLSVTATAEPLIDTLAFGSCLRQWKPQPIWEAIIAAQPDVFLFIGDNIYADTTDITVMRREYQRLEADPNFQRLRALCPIHATWDDHDYGANDAGAEYPMRDASEQAFLNFFRIPEGAPERQRPGVYNAHLYGPVGRRVQLILLDTRYFRSPLKRAPRTMDCPRVNYAPNTDPEATILGDAQWQWLEQELRKPAELRIIASSIQVIPDQHCFEKWANFPRERERLGRLIRDSGAQAVIFISGDRHLAEISRWNPNKVGYPLYEVTSSGLNSAGAGKGERNRYRLTTDNFRHDNFGLIHIDWEASEPLIHLQVRDVEGKAVVIHTVRLLELKR